MAAINFDALNQVYNHYLTSYAPKSSTSLDSHKKSELRGVYNSMLKINKESPLYIIDTSSKSKAYAIGLKESARELHNTIKSLGGLEEDSLLNKKVAFSSNPALADVTYIGNNDNIEDTPSFSLEVKSLASPQTNMGDFLPSDEMNTLSPDTYSFDITIHDMSYEFQFIVSEEDTNKDVQDRLSRLITNSNIGITAQTIEDGEGNSSLSLSSVATGSEDGKNIFHVSDTYTSKHAGMVDYLGIGEVTRNASNAVFFIDGEQRSAYSNHFTIEKAYELELKGISENENDVTLIGIKDDTESLKENIRTLIGGYNDFIHSSIVSDEEQPKSRQLLHEMKNISSLYMSKFEAVGLSSAADGTLSLNEKQLDAVFNDDDFKEQISSIKDFAGSLLRKTDQVSLNPMNYVNKTIVAYKNPGKNFSAPYAPSAYTGMMFNYYC